MENQKITFILKFLPEKIRSFFLSNNWRKPRFLILVILFFVILSVGILILPPRTFPLGDVFTVQSGDSLQAISLRLKEEKIIKSVFIFRTTAIILGGERKIIAGDYLLSEKENSLALAYRLVKGDFHLEAIKITIPEGWNVFEMADYLSDKIINFDEESFISKAKEKEGYLFPDTYFISPTIKIDDLISLMNNNFEKKIEEIKKEIELSNHSLSDVIIMASILEGEALPEDRNIVAGILWKRISVGMPLQVDSTFEYINGKDSYSLTLDDLKIDSPYNTYKYKGLPPGPISNPGIQAILSAINPTKSKYLYFLTSRDGTIYYAKTFEEHKVNKERYLR